MASASTTSPAQSRESGARALSAARGWSWTEIARHVIRGFVEHRILSLAAAVTYYALLAIFPAIAAIVSLYGLFSDPAKIQAHLDSLSTTLPGGAIQVMGDQIKSLAAAQSSKTFGIAFIGGLALALWSASSGVKALFDALNVIYGEREKRGFVQLAGIALLFTLGAIILVLLGVLATLVVPIVREALSLPGPLAWVIAVARWPILLVAVAIGLAVTYRYGPSRDHPRWHWMSWGSGFASAGWLGVSALFSWYAANFGSFNATYGSLGAVIGFMTWLWLSAAVVLLGAEINAAIAAACASDEAPPKARD